MAPTLFAIQHCLLLLLLEGSSTLHDNVVTVSTIQSNIMKVNILVDTCVRIDCCLQQPP